MADNKQIAQAVLQAIGGAQNVKDATHCMTRLRIALKDDSIPHDDEVKAIDGVLSVIRGAQMYQVVIGTNVPHVYEAFCEMAHIDQKEAIDDAEAAAADAQLSAPKKAWTPQRVGRSILDYMAGCMTPLIPVLLAGGLCSAINAIFGPGLLNLYSAESDIYILFNFVYNAAFYFMPILAGVNAGRHLGISPMLGGFIGCILMAPAFAAYAASGDPFTVYGIPCDTSTSYAQTVLPIMLCVPLYALVYKLIAKVMPDVLTTVFTPILSLVISLPFMLCLLAPLGTLVGNAISGGLAWFGNNTGFVGVAVISAIWEFLVVTGMHMALMMPMMASYFETGVQTGAMVSGSFATWACFGVALGAALRLKSKAGRGNAIGMFVSGIVGGVTEPTLYGLCFEHTRCFLGIVIGGFVGGAYAGITQVCAYAITSSNFLALLSFVGGETANVVNGIISCALALIVSTVVTYFFGFSKQEIETA